MDEVLTQIFNNTGYNYQIIDRQVLIKASTEPNQATNAAQQKTKIVSGVINDETGLPVIGAKRGRKRDDKRYNNGCRRE